MKLILGVCKIAVVLGVVCVGSMTSLNRTALAQSLEEMAVMAMELGHDDLVVRALERGANVNGRVREHTLLAHAVLNERLGAAAALIRRGADVNLASGPANQQRTPLAIALQTARRDYDMFGISLGLMRLGADPKTMQSLPARTAISFANVTLYQAVISAGGSPSDLGPDGKMVFHLAVEATAETLRRALTGCDRTQWERFLTLSNLLEISISEGADLTRPINNRPMLSYALSSGLFAFSEAILATGTSPTQAGSDNRRPVQIAYAYALPSADRCNAPVEEPPWRLVLRAGIAAAREEMIAKMLRTMLQRN